MPETSFAGVNPFLALLEPPVSRPGMPKPVSDRVRECALAANQKKTQMRRGQQGAPANPWGLTELQYRIMKALVEGRRQVELARDLGIAHKSIWAHTERVREKIGAATLAQAAVLFDRVFRV